MNGARPEAILVNGSAHFLGGESDYHPLDLAPVAEANEVSGISAPFGSNGRLEAGIVAEALDQLGRIGKGRPSGDEGGAHGFSVRLQPFPDCRQASSTPR
jgi:hypothetical protein